MEEKKKLPFGVRAAFAVTTFCGTWKFIAIVILYILVWVALNIVALIQAWDPYPFIMLNLTLSCIAALQAPIILMGQSVAAGRDRIKAERDFAVNRKAEREVEDIQKDLEQIKRMIRELKK